MLELAPFIELTGSKSKLFIWLYLKMILKQRQPDISLAKKLQGWGA
jgi:hypothetical protein